MSLLGIPGLQVVAVWEFAAERHVVVQTRDRAAGVLPHLWCRAESRAAATRCGICPPAGKATRLVWLKRDVALPGLRGVVAGMLAEIPPGRC